MLEDQDQLERDFFSIEYENGEKILHYYGWTYERDDEELPWASVELTFCYAPLSEIIEQGVGEWMTDAPVYVQQYQGDYTEEGIIDVIEHYFDGEPGIHITGDDITEDLDYGDYWM